MRSAGRAVRALIPERAKPLLRNTYYPLERLTLRALYAGRHVSCPCCGRDFRRFRPFNGRSDAQCPWCDSLERHRLLCLYLRREQLQPDSTLLHFAPERALDLPLARIPGLRRLTADPVLPNATLRLDIMNIALEDASVDAVICSHVLEHVEEDRKAMRELHRVLRPGGRALIMCPVQEGRTETLEGTAMMRPPERLRLFGQEDHLRVYGTDLCARLVETGFEVRYVGLDDFDPAEIARHRLTKRDFWGADQIYDCRKLG